MRNEHPDPPSSSRGGEGPTSHRWNAHAAAVALTLILVGCSSSTSEFDTASNNRKQPLTATCVDTAPAQGEFGYEDPFEAVDTWIVVDPKLGVADMTVPRPEPDYDGPLAVDLAPTLTELLPGLQGNLRVLAAASPTGNVYTLLALSTDAVVVHPSSECREGHIALAEYMVSYPEDIERLTDPDAWDEIRDEVEKISPSATTAATEPDEIDLPWKERSPQARSFYDPDVPADIEAATIETTLNVTLPSEWAAWDNVGICARTTTAKAACTSTSNPVTPLYLPAAALEGETLTLYLGDPTAATTESNLGDIDEIPIAITPGLSIDITVAGPPTSPNDDPATPERSTLTATTR